MSLSSWLLTAALLVACSDAGYSDGGRRTDLGNIPVDGIELGVGGQAQSAGRGGAAGSAGSAGVGGNADLGGSAGVRSDP